MSNSEKEKAIWKTYPGISFLQANQFGEIRTVDHYTESKDGKRHLVKGRVLKQSDNGTGYLRVGFNMNGKNIALLVHRIVATCFLPNPDNLPEVNHKDNNPKNNTVNNLEWCTSQYNTAYREKYGISAKEATKVLRKPVAVVNLKTFETLIFESQNEAARQLNIDRRHVNNAVRGLRKTTGGYWFCEVDKDTVEKTRVKFGDKVAHEVEELIEEQKSNKKC